MKLVQFNNEPLLIDTNKEAKTPEEAVEIYSEYLQRDVFNFGLMAGIIIGVVVTLLGCFFYYKHFL